MKKILLFTSFIMFFLMAGQSSKVQAALCCPSGYGTGAFDCPFGTDTTSECCKRNGFADYDVVNKIQCPDGGGGGDGGGGAEIGAGKLVTKEVIDKLNPLIQENSSPALAEELSTPGGIVSRFLGVFAFPIAGLILFVMLIWGGVEMMAGSATSKSVDAGKQRVTTALLGFLLLFASFWIARILEMMFGIKIL